MYKIILVIVCYFLLFSSNLFSQNWTKISNVKPYINYIYNSKTDINKVYVAANDLPTDISLSKATFPLLGNGIIVSKDGGNSFNDTAMTDKSIYCITTSLSNPNIMIASARKYNLNKILFSWDKGNTWEEYSERCSGTHQIMKIAHKIVNDKELFLTASLNSFFGYKFSEDFFDKCDEIPGFKIVPHDIKFSTLKKDWVFMTGDNNTEGKIFRSLDNGKTFEEFNKGLEGLRILSVLPSGINPNVVYCGADSVGVNEKIFGKGIYVSNDTGRTWQLHSVAGHSVFEIKEHPLSPYIIAAACGNGGVWVSGKGGNSFEPINGGLPENTSVRKVEFKHSAITQSGFELFASVYGEGLYKHSGIIVSVDDKSEPIDFKISSVYPQPANDLLYIEINSNSESFSLATIYDLTGTELLSQQISLTSGINLVKISDITSLKSGTYLITINTNNEILRKTFVISR